MVKKRKGIDFWIFITAIFGASFLVFNKWLASQITLSNSIIIWLGIILLTISIIISFSKLWR